MNSRIPQISKTYIQILKEDEYSIFTQRCVRLLNWENETHSPYDFADQSQLTKTAWGVNMYR